MPEKHFAPYQPFLLRLLHGLTGACVLAAILTAFWTYNTYDGRWGTLPLPDFAEIEGIHGTFGLWALLLFPLFVLYAFHRGQRRLLQPDSWQKLHQVGKPIWWYTLHRSVNTLTLLALSFALFSGKMMDHRWLPQGELTHRWYYAHLISWGILVVCIALHVLMGARVGGMSFLGSIWHRRVRSADSPTLWRQHLRQWWQGFQPTAIAEWQRLSLLSKCLEVGILATIAGAWILSLAKEL